MSAGEKPARATSFLRLVFESLDIYLFLIYKKRPEHTEQMRQNKASLLTTYQTIQKSLVLFSKESDMSWVTLWLSCLSLEGHRICNLII